MSANDEINRQDPWWWLRAGLILVVVAGLAIDAFVHLDLASSYDGVKSSVLTQGDLFRAEAALAIIAALALVVRPRRWTALIALLVSAGGFAAVLLYQYVNVGAIGPLPNMYDPVSFPEKTLSVCAEGIAAVAALVLLVLIHGPSGVREHGQDRGGRAGVVRRSGVAEARLVCRAAWARCWLKAPRNWLRKASMGSSGAIGPGISPSCQCQDAICLNTDGSRAMIEIGTSWVAPAPLTVVWGWWSPNMMSTRFGSFSSVTHDVRAVSEYWIDRP